jgi:acyl-CoA synthetase (AMP-forming)/AMP-acid ligase II/ubiquinone/menaquinone biosynthesis C-methylase UbiE/acyl carrier protein
MLNVFLEDPGIYRIRSLKRVICSGEALPLEYRDRFFACFAKNVGLHNLYGPTEASVDVTAWRCERDSNRRTIPIGRPIANTGIYILDRNLNPVPIGIPGEIHINGIQLAHGYLNQPDLTMERFCLRRPWGLFSRKLPPWTPRKSFSLERISFSKKFCGGPGGGFSKEPPGRRRHILYKTGDLGRWLADGSIEFLGRKDFQVKVRGFRIELGEIESHIRQHEALTDAVVLAGEASPGSEEKKLTGYVVPDHDYWKMQPIKPGSERIDLEKEQVSDWEGVFNDTYTGDAAEPDPTFNIIGWNSSYTNGPIPAAEMRLWVDHTVERILSLKPKQVMEIGCGTGLFLFPVIPYCDRYLGTDIAGEGLNYIRRQLERLKEEKPAAPRAEVELMLRSADNFDGIAENRLDLVILNSVVQYFPSADYLVEVLAGAVERVKPGGHIFIGDVRCLPLLKTFHASVEFYKAAPGAAREQVLSLVMNRLSLEQELVIDPDFFTALKNHLPKIKYVQLPVKHGRYANELSKFRYDVILHIDDNDYPEVPPDLVLDWKLEALNIREIRRQLTGMGKEPGTVVITGVPNGRIAHDAHILKWLIGKEGPATAGEFKEFMARGTQTAIDPEDFRELSEDMPYDIVIVLSNPDSTCYTYDVICKHHCLSPGKSGDGLYLAGDKKIAPRPWHEFTNNPLLVKISSQLVPGLRRFLKDKLPEYMVPSYFILLDRLPLTANGKLDRRALPEPVRVAAKQESKREWVKPRTHEEKLFVNTWKEVLLLDEVGITDNFFELGGDSINAIRMISRINQAGFQLSIQDLYKYQDIEELVMAAKKEKIKKPAVFEAEEEAVEEFFIGLDREEIARNLPDGVEIEDIYPATPLQCHMVNYLRNHPVTEPPVFIFQRIESPLHMKVDIPTVEKTVQRLIDIYPIFRTLLYWKNLNEPVQVICKNVKTTILYHDLSHLSPHRQNRQIEELMKEEWGRGIDRDQPIPFRISLIKLAGDLYRYFLTCDYPRMEGWGARFFYRDLGNCYAALLAGRDFTPQTDNYYKSYLFNVKKQDREEAKKYWQSVFKGFTGPKSLLCGFPGNQPHRERKSGFARQFLSISAETTAGLDRILRKERVPFSTLVQAVWAMILSRYANESDIVYGFLTTGRSIASAGIESMVGHAINILPVRLKINPGQLLIDWLKQLLDRHMEWLHYEYTQIEHIYEWLGLSREQPLFESFVVLQNLAREMGKEDPAPGGRERLDSFFAKMEYPLRLDIYPGTEIEFMCNYYRRFVADKVIKGLLEDFKTLIEAAAKNPAQTSGGLMNLIQPGYRSFQEDLTGKTVRRIQ